MADYCTEDEVRTRWSAGDGTTISSSASPAIAEAITDASGTIDEEVRNLRGQAEGWSFLPALDGDGNPVTETRRYTGNGSPLLFIDDAVLVSSVALTASDGTVLRQLAAGRDYLPWPLNGLPVTGLTLVSGTWPDNPGGVSVVLARGYALTLPASVRDAAIEETLRTLRRAQAGIDDRSGTAPFGQEATGPALLAATARKLYKFRLGHGMLRRAG